MAVISTEQRLLKLEEEAKSLKATYTVSGSLVEMFTQKADFRISGTQHDVVRIRFRPQYGRGQNNLIKLSVMIPDGVYGQERPSFFVEPQDGSGDVVARIYVDWHEGMTYTIRVIASGTSPGTFSRI